MKMQESPVMAQLRKIANDLDVEIMSSVVIEDSRFSVWSGSSKPNQHHYGMGGLAKHTLEVATLCIRNNCFLEESKKVSEKHLFLAALFHDAGKMWDYEPASLEYSIKNGTGLDEWRGTGHKNLIHHIARSALIWEETAKFFNFPDRDEVLHAILSHHGLREWGSPVAPRSRLAWLLHLCDSISARMDDCDKFGR